MKRPLLLALLAWAGVTAQIKEEPLPPLPAAPTLQPVPYRRPHFGGPRDIHASACGVSAPSSVSEFWRRADGVVRVRVVSHAARNDYGTGTQRPSILSAVEATVLEVFKRHPRGADAGETMTITHPGGTMLRVDGQETLTVNGFPPPRPGTEWFLFLRWWEDRQEFWIAYLDQAAFQIMEGMLVRPRAIGRPLPERTPEALADALKRAILDTTTGK